MKIQFRSMLFALVLPLAACGNGDEGRTVSMAPQDFLPKPAMPANTNDVAETPSMPSMPVAEQPVAVTPVEKPIDAKTLSHIDLARQYIDKGERGLAISEANKAIKLAPYSSQAWNTKGRAELAAKNYENAITAFTQAVELNSDNAFAWNNLGYTELLLKRYQDAADHLTEATQKKDATGFMFNNLGTALEHLDKLDDARTAYDAGGKLGSAEASASRKRLDGVKTIVVDNVASTDAVKTDSKTDTVKTDNGYSLNNDEDGDEEPVAEQVKASDGDGSGSGSGSGSDEAPPSDTATH